MFPLTRIADCKRAMREQGGSSMPKRLTMSSLDKRWANPRAFAVCMGVDAMRLCLGMRPATFHPKDIRQWLDIMEGANG